MKSVKFYGKLLKSLKNIYNAKNHKFVINP